MELEAMFCRAGKIIDSFIPVDCRTGTKRGISFVRFKTEQEVQCAIDLARGRSWGGRRISVSIAHPHNLRNQQSPIQVSDAPNRSAWGAGRASSFAQAQ